jgi:hypothetical protein
MNAAAEVFTPGARTKEIIRFIRKESHGEPQAALRATTFAEFTCLGIAGEIERPVNY